MYLYVQRERETDKAAAAVFSLRIDMDRAVHRVYFGFGAGSAGVFQFPSPIQLRLLLYLHDA